MFWDSTLIRFALWMSTNKYTSPLVVSGSTTIKKKCEKGKGNC